MKVSVLSVPLWSTYNKWLVWRHHVQECGDSTHKIWHNCKSKNEALAGLRRKKRLLKKWLRIEIYKYQRIIYIFKLKINIYFLDIIQLTPTYNNCFKWPIIQFLQVLMRFSKKRDICSASLEKHMCKLYSLVSLPPTAYIHIFWFHLYFVLQSHQKTGLHETQITRHFCLI